MKIYLDEDTSASLLLKLLRRAGHDVERPVDLGRTEDSDPEVLRQAILLQRTLISHNQDDFKDLHDLVQTAEGQHFGILVICKDNDPTRDLSPGGIVRALQKLEQSGIAITNEFYILNAWR